MTCRDNVVARVEIIIRFICFYVGVLAVSTLFADRCYADWVVDFTGTGQCEGTPGYGPNVSHTIGPATFSHGWYCNGAYMDQVSRYQYMRIDFSMPVYKLEIWGTVEGGQAFYLDNEYTNWNLGSGLAFYVVKKSNYGVSWVELTARPDPYRNTRLRITRVVFSTDNKPPVVCPKIISPLNNSVTNQEQYSNGDSLMKFRFETDGTQVATWNIKQYYQPVKTSLPVTQLQLSLQTSKGNPVFSNGWYNQGGVYDATITAPNCPNQTIKFYGVGGTLKDSWISDKLKALYAGGKTPGLLCGVAQKESSYMQYNPALTRFGIKSFWPNENSSGFAGLMQIPYDFNKSWNWKMNTEYGAQLFKGDKKNFAVMYVKQLRDVIYDQSDLSDMKDDRMENMQLWLYNCENGLCSGKLRQYYIPYCPGSIRFHSNNVPTTLSQCTKTNKCMCIGGSWSWKINDTIPPVSIPNGNNPPIVILNPHVKYVSDVRGNVNWRCP